MNFLKYQNAGIAIRFGMPWLRTKVNSPILPILTLKFVGMTTSLEPWVRLESYGSLPPGE